MKRRPRNFRSDRPARASEAPRQAKSAAPAAPGEPERLHKVLASAGVGSRRHCEEMILAGRVEVDGQTVVELGLKVNPARQKIYVDGEPLRRPRRVYYLVNKPPGVVSTNYDQAGRPRVIDMLPNIPGHLFTVGRLDLSSEGLILVTNDGELANRLTHPRYGVPKTYHALVAGEFTTSEAAVLAKGVRLAEGWAKAEHVKIRSQRGKSTLLEIVLSEGRNREIRRLLARVGHKVLQLKRVGIGPVRLGDLPVGEHRRLKPLELAALEQASREGRQASRRRVATPKPPARPARAVHTAGKPPDRRRSKPGGARKSQ